MRPQYFSLLIYLCKYYEYNTSRDRKGWKESWFINVNHFLYSYQSEILKRIIWFAAHEKDWIQYLKLISKVSFGVSSVKSWLLYQIYIYTALDWLPSFYSGIFNFFENQHKYGWQYFFNRAFKLCSKSCQTCLCFPTELYFG